MPTKIEAAFIGDSHGMIVQAAATDNQITFRHTITSASAMFGGSTLSASPDGTLLLNLAANRIDPEVHSAEKVKQRLKKAKDLARGLENLFEEPVPVYSMVGATARTFALRIVTANSGQKMSRKLAKHAAKEFFTDFRQQYSEIAKHCSEMHVIYGPTRFTPETHDLWLAYDEAISEELAEIGVNTLDLRADLGDETLLLRPEYYPDPDDFVHANAAWGLAVAQAINQHVNQQTST